MANNVLVSVEALSQARWWGSLSPSEQRTIKLESQSLGEEMLKIGMSKLAIGQHLEKIQSILEPKRFFVKFLHAQCRISSATAYRYIESYTKTKDRVPEIVLKTAITHGFDVITKASIVEKLPPPKTQNTLKIVQYLEQIEAKSRQMRARAPEPEYDSDALMREALNFVTTRWNRLPNNSRSRNRWVEQLVGMILSDTKQEEEKTFAPVPVPENFRVIVGRPRLTASAAA